MINKKFILSFLVLFVFSLVIYADGKNFVAILNGANIANSSNATNYAFAGQSVVFDTTETKKSVSQSAFASVFYSVQSDTITFTNNTSSEVFTDITVPLKVTVKSTGDKIEKIQYRIWQGENPNWNDWKTSPAIDYSFSANTEVEFSTNVVFSQGHTVNFFRVYAQLEDGSKRWSGDYTVNISSGLAQNITFTSPDPITKLSTLDPLIETTDYSINLTTATITLYKGNSASSGNEVYSVELTSSTNKIYEMYNTEKGKISYTHSKFITIYNEQHGTSLPLTLKQNAYYTMEIKTVNGTDTVTFKALSGGVADILPYPSPFNPKKGKVKIRYLLAKDSRVTIKLYDKAGKIVCKLIQSEERSAGTNEEQWDGRNYAGETLATGAYIVEIIANSSSGSDRRYTALAIVGK